MEYIMQYTIRIEFYQRPIYQDIRIFLHFIYRYRRKNRQDTEKVYACIESHSRSLDVRSVLILQRHRYVISVLTRENSIYLTERVDCIL